MGKNNMKKTGMADAVKVAYTETAGAKTQGKFDTFQNDEVSEKEIKGFVVRCGGIVDALCIIYADGSGAVHGNPRGGGENRIMLDEGDNIQSISGVCDSNYNGHKAVSRLTIETAKGKKYGPFGSWGGREFKISVPENGTFAGFFGTASTTERGGYIESLGMSYVEANEEMLKGMLGGMGGFGDSSPF